MLGRDRLDRDQITPADPNRQADQRARDIERKGPRPPESSDRPAYVRPVRKAPDETKGLALVQRRKSGVVPLKLRSALLAESVNSASLCSSALPARPRVGLLIWAMFDKPENLCKSRSSAGAR